MNFSQFSRILESKNDIFVVAAVIFSQEVAMIVSFSVSNFRSFLTEETFSLVASNRLSGSHDGHAIPIPDSKEKVLRTATIYGANSAGKSNLFRECL